MQVRELCEGASIVQSSSSIQSRFQRRVRTLLAFGLPKSVIGLGEAGY